MTDERDPYRILGVSPDASDHDIREAYRARARRLHPDVVGEAALDDMRALNQAWAQLKDPDRRAAHDAAHGRSRGRGESSSGAGDSGPSGGGARTSGEFSGQPSWTGAAGPPPGRPWGTVLASGIYAGWSLGEIARRDRGYLAWYRDRPEGKKLRQEIDRILALGSPDAGTPRDTGKGGRRR